MRDRTLFLPSSLSRPVNGVPWIAAAICLFLFNFIFPQIANTARSTVVDVFTPLLHIVAKPAEMTQNLQGQWNDLAHLEGENTRLHEEIKNLKAWAQVAQQYEEENKNLKNLLKYKDESTLSFLTTRVIAQSGGNFSDSVVVTAGAHDGVEKDMIALDEDGVVGRVIEPGEWSARILLLTDLNFRLPVMVEEAKQRAILAGQSQKPPKLVFLVQDSNIKPGMRVVTSGHGGIFPAGLPVGQVKEIKDKEITVEPFGHLDRLEIIRLVRYQLPAPAATMAPAPPEKTP